MTTHGMIAMQNLTFDGIFFKSQIHLEDLMGHVILNTRKDENGLKCIWVSQPTPETRNGGKCHLFVLMEHT